MTNQRNNVCDELEPQLAAFALGEVLPSQKLLAHLPICDHCRRQLQAYAQVVGVLPYAAPALEPSAELRLRILAAVEPQVTLAPELQQRVSMVDEFGRAGAPRGPSQRSRRRVLPNKLFSWSVALAALFALLVWNITLQQRLAEATAQIATSRAGWRSVTMLFNDQQVQRYALRGESATGHFWTSSGSPAACLVAQGLPTLEMDQVYRVWLMRGEQPTPAGVFVARNGGGWVLVEPNQALHTYDQVVVTLGQRDVETFNGPEVLRGTLTNAESVGAADREFALQWMLNRVER